MIVVQYRFRLNDEMSEKFLTVLITDFEVITEARASLKNPFQMLLLQEPRYFILPSWIFHSGQQFIYNQKKKQTNKHVS